MRGRFLERQTSARSSERPLGLGLLQPSKGVTFLEPQLCGEGFFPGTTL
jgi:hypothetical protein